MKTPRELGYSMPAEWERHDAIWLSWPHDPMTFPDRIERVEQVYLKIISAIHKSEDVNLFVRDGAMKEQAASMLAQEDVDLEKIRFFVRDYADVWFRDYGPIFVTNREQGKLAMVHWIFNAWGGKYDELRRDTVIPSIINRHMRIGYFQPGIVMEGGSIDVNGRGTLMTTEQCLLNENRNPHLDRAGIETYLRDFLGVSHFIWLKQGVAGDDTDGHIDDIARFVSPDTILCAYEEDEADENHEVLEENFETLQASNDQDGNPLRVVRLPMPGFVGDEKGRLPASYANFYIGNNVVLVPVFGHENDRIAIRTIQDVFPDRKTIGIDCSDLVYGLGTIHCISQQQPSV